MGIPCSEGQERADGEASAGVLYYASPRDRLRAGGDHRGGLGRLGLDRAAV